MLNTNLINRRRQEARRNFLDAHTVSTLNVPNKLVASRTILPLRDAQQASKLEKDGGTRKWMRVKRSASGTTEAVILGEPQRETQG